MPRRTVAQFLERITRGKPVPGILLLGSDLYLRDLCRAKLVEAYLPETARDWSVTRFSVADESLDRILSQAQTLPMLSTRQLLFAEDLEALEGLEQDAREASVEQLAAYLDDPALFTVLVLEAKALDKRTRLAKMLVEKALVVEVELDAKSNDRETAAAMMALQMAREMGVELDRDAAEELADILDDDLARIHNELEKLTTYAGNRRKVTRADVEALVISAKKYSVWQLAEMLAGGQRSKALEFLDNLLREGEQPAGLVGAIAWMYRKLVEAQEMPTHLSGWQAAQRLGMRPEMAELALRQSRKISQQQLLEGLAALYEADNRLKSGAADDRAVMEFLVARLTSVPASAQG